MTREEVKYTLMHMYRQCILGNECEEYGCSNCEDALNMAIEALTERPKGECASCKRSSDYCCKTDGDKTRCPIEEHYVLPMDGYCHLYEPYKGGGDK